MEGDKKIVILYILEVLREYSDKNHLLTYNEIVELIDKKHGVRPDVKAVANNITSLTNAGYEIIKCGWKGCYLLDRDFESGELMYLIDAVNSSNSIASKQAKELIDKLTKNCSRYERKKFVPIHKIEKITKSKNRELFYIIEILGEAIESGKKVKFNYNEHNFEKELKPRREGKEYLINPYFMVNSRGKYYLVCNYDKYDDISNYKVECITNIEIVDEPIKPITSLKNMENFSMRNYVEEHIYMTYGNSVDAKILIEDSKYISEIVDWFGDGVTIARKDDKIYATLKVNEQALIYWSLQYGEHVEVIEPKETRVKIKEAIDKISKKYN